MQPRPASVIASASFSPDGQWVVFIREKVLPGYEALAYAGPMWSVQADSPGTATMISLADDNVSEGDSLAWQPMS